MGGDSKGMAGGKIRRDISEGGNHKGEGGGVEIRSVLGKTSELAGN